MRLGSFDFSPGLIPTLAMLVAFPVLLSLGFWQLDRAEHREQVLRALDARGESPVLDLNAQSPDADDAWYRDALAHGRYDTARQFLLDNQTHQGEAGYHVLTPLRLNGRDAAVLVDRGWISAGGSRAELPSLPLTGDVREVRGHLDQGPTTGIRLGGMADGEQGWPLRLQYIEYEELEQRLGYELLPMVLRLDPEADDGYVRQWRPEHALGYGPERNRGYAVQWFGLAATLLIIYFVVNLKRRPQGKHDER